MKDLNIDQSRHLNLKVKKEGIKGIHINEIIEAVCIHGNITMEKLAKRIKTQGISDIRIDDRKNKVRREYRESLCVEVIKRCK